MIGILPNLSVSRVVKFLKGKGSYELLSEFFFAKEVVLLDDDFSVL